MNPLKIKSNLTSIVLLSFALTLGTPVHASIYKWTDEGGEVHYSQTPPPGVPATTVEIQDTHPSSSALKEKTEIQNLQNKQQATEQVKKMEQEKSQALEKIAEEKAQNCQTAKDNLTEFNEHVRMRLTDPTTNKTVMLTPEQRDEEIAKIQTIIDENCN